MDTVIIASSPRAASQSFSAKFSLAFSEGLSQAGVTSQIFYLSDRGQWPAAQTAIMQKKHTVFVLPIFFGTVPGIFLEFLQELVKRNEEASAHSPERSMAFIVHAGLPGSGDFNCCKSFLLTIPDMLQARFSGIIGLLDTISLGFFETELEKTLDRFRRTGAEYAENTCRFSHLETLWGPDDMTQAECETYCRFINRFCRHVSAVQGCEVPLNYAPYNKEQS